jgi:hypothetical protein
MSRSNNFWSLFGVSQKISISKREEMHHKLSHDKDELDISKKDNSQNSDSTGSKKDKLIDKIKTDILNKDPEQIPETEA